MARHTVPRHPIDLTGLRFGRLIAQEITGDNSSSGIVWQCLCDCGAIAYVPRGSLIKGNTKSCGCGKLVGTRPKSHGGTATFGTGTKEYGVWEQMMSRCFKSTHKHFGRYGGRGITVCERWRHFDNFRADMGSQPPGLTLERIDNDGGYSPDNCKWATRREQLQNTAKNRYIEHDGLRLCLSEWGRRLGLGRRGVISRLEKGWSEEEAVTTPRHGARPPLGGHKETPSS